MPEFDLPEPEKTNIYGTGAIRPVFKKANFPLSRQTIIENYGNRKIEYKIGETITVREIFDNSKKENFNSIDEVISAFNEKLSQG